MAGHSKWANIKNRKASVDAKKSKAFGLISKLITIAVKEGGSGAPDSNPRLRLALEKARAANMPNANVQKAIDKGLGKGGGGQIEEILYEGYGPGGIGIMVRALSDNRNRTGGEIKHIFDRNNGNLGGPGSVSYLFERDGEEYKVKVGIPIDANTQTQLQELLDALEEHEDVEMVVSNNL